MTTAKERVELELKELEERLNKLKTFVLSETFLKLSTTYQMLLMSQIDIMTSCMRIACIINLSFEED